MKENGLGPSLGNKIPQDLGIGLNLVPLQGAELPVV